jgi:hypothetical protein
MQVMDLNAECSAASFPLISQDVGHWPCALVGAVHHRSHCSALHPSGLAHSLNATSLAKP